VGERGTNMPRNQTSERARKKCTTKSRWCVYVYKKLARFVFFVLAYLVILLRVELRVEGFVAVAEAAAVASTIRPIHRPARASEEVPHHRGLAAVSEREQSHRCKFHNIEHVGRSSMLVMLCAIDFIGCGRGSLQAMRLHPEHLSRRPFPRKSRAHIRSTALHRCVAAAVAAAAAAAAGHHARRARGRAGVGVRVRAVRCKADALPDEQLQRRLFRRAPRGARERGESRRRWQLRPGARRAERRGDVASACGPPVG